MKNYRLVSLYYSGTSGKFTEMRRTEIEDRWVNMIPSERLQTAPVSGKPASQAFHSPPKPLTSKHIRDLHWKAKGIPQGSVPESNIFFHIFIHSLKKMQKRNRVLIKFLAGTEFWKGLKRPEN